jgi:asparagine synthase (glutamine-hydrolysing)
MVSAYLTTIRTVLGDRTMFAGVRAVRPGELVRIDLGGERPSVAAAAYGRGQPTLPDGLVELREAAEQVRATVEQSVSRHLRADVPVCALLSGGLDSTIVSALAMRGHPRLRTYAAGAPLPTECREIGLDGDLSWARMTAQILGTDHAEAHVERQMFADRWAWMVRSMGMPLSTPNEVAIWAVASRLRADGCVVTLSGEGADELFAGYEGPMRAAMEFCAQAAAHSHRDHALHELTANAWIAPAMKGSLLRSEVWSALDDDAFLIGAFEDEFARSADESGGDGVAAHLRLQRRVNLTGLLQRLDSATMLAGVEGRTPFADVRVAELAEALPLALKFAMDDDAADHDGGGVAAPVTTAVRTKIVLREAFRGVVPEGVLTRPKASFPLPYRPWMPDQAEALRRSEFVRAMFEDPVIEAVAAEPERLWNLAWPMMNLALWAK